MGPVRTEVMRQSVLDAVQIASGHIASGGAGSLTILDLGGGTGADAVRLAQLGHAVTVVDPSPDALAALQRRAAEAELGEGSTAPGSVIGVLGDTADLPDHVADDSVDLVVCHGVLQVVDDPEAALTEVARVLRPGGHASVVVAGRRAAVVARALAGDFAGAARIHASSLETWDVRAQGPRRFDPTEIEALLSRHGLPVVRSFVLRVFTDLVPSALVDVEPGAREALYELERQVRDDDAFAALAVGLQLVGRLD